MQQITLDRPDAKDRIICGDCLAAIKTMPSESVHCCVTSPPYYGLRDYGVDGQIGLEQSPEEYIQKLVAVFREVRRVLRDDGTLWINIGDSYAVNSGNQPPTNTRNSCGHTAKAVPRGYKPKDLIGIPWMLAFALRDDGWYLRQDIIWHKPNCMPESVRDRCTKSHEYIFLLSKYRRYYFDAEAISEPIAASPVERLSQDVDHQKGSNRQPGKTNGPMKAVGPRFGGNKYQNGAEENRTKSGNEYALSSRRNKRDVWTVPTKGYKGAHFATYPPELIRPCILAGTPPGGMVLDPFLGSGTTGEVAIETGRYFTGIELNEEYTRMSAARTGAPVNYIDRIQASGF